MNKPIKLDRFLVNAGLGSRRQTERLIKAGKIRVNGERILTPAHNILPTIDNVVYQGNPVFQDAPPTYIMLNKPRGYITTANDEKGRTTVFKLVQTPTRVFPVGRLDRDSEGLLLFTNDGELANRLLHPRYKVEKRYAVLLNRAIDPALVEKFRDGVFIERNVRVTAKLVFPQRNNRKFCQVYISQGKNRQIRRMFSKFNYRVTALQRIEMGKLHLGKLASGAWRYLTEKEISLLKMQTGLADADNK